jgi:hypothetical protein
LVKVSGHSTTGLPSPGLRRNHLVNGSGATAGSDRSGAMPPRRLSAADHRRDVIALFARPGTLAASRNHSGSQPIE